MSTGAEQSDAVIRNEEEPGLAHSRRWLALATVATVQLMIVLDLAVVFVALPSIQNDLDISTADRQWVVSAYAITFGGLLLLGGRLVDYVGRKRMFIGALAGFALVSALGGAASSGGMLFAARAAQGVLAAVLAPAVLSLISDTYTEKAERAKAFGIYGMVSGSGAAIGMLLGGSLTLWSWRLVLLINVPIAIAVAVVAVFALARDTTVTRSRYDIAGAITATAGMVCLAQGFTSAGTNGWGSAVTQAFLVGGVLLLCAFVVIEARTRSPLLPLRIVTQFSRGMLYLAALLANAAQLSMFLFLTYYYQETLHYNPIQTGLVFLPFALAVISVGMSTASLVVRFGPLPVMVVGAALSVAALLLFTSLGADTGFGGVVAPEIMMGAGVALSLFPLNNVVLLGIDEADAGVAGATVSTTQQMGGSMGTALLNTVFTGAVAGYVAERHLAKPTTGANLHGYHTVFVWEAAMYAAALVLIALVWQRNRRTAAN
ncbi:MFS transporter [Actinophytocola sp.]|uniref:MFS transporter n=1 Tax=Actinophytocola sp. TaxID=1872138 RepID=UPI003899FD4B